MHNRWIISFNKSWIWLIVLFRRLSCKRNNTWIISFTIFCLWWSYWWSLMARKWHNTWIITFHEFRFGWCNRWSFIIWSSRSYNRWIVSFRIFWILVFCFILVRIAKLRRREESASSKTIIKAMTTIFYKAKKTVIESTRHRLLTDICYTVIKATGPSKDNTPLLVETNKNFDVPDIFVDLLIFSCLPLLLDAVCFLFLWLR